MVCGCFSLFCKKIINIHIVKSILPKRSNSKSFIDIESNFQIFKCNTYIKIFHYGGLKSKIEIG